MKKDNHKELKEKLVHLLPSALTIKNDGGRTDVYLDSEKVWSFILQEVIPLAEKKGREEVYKQFPVKNNRYPAPEPRWEKSK